MWKFTRWFTLEWYKYLLDQPYRQKRTWAMVWCRVKGHPSGTIFYNLNGTEPNPYCKDCGEDIG